MLAGMSTHANTQVGCTNTAAWTGLADWPISIDLRVQWLVQPKSHIYFRTGKSGK